MILGCGFQTYSMVLAGTLHHMASYPHLIAKIAQRNESAFSRAAPGLARIIGAGCWESRHILVNELPWLDVQALDPSELPLPTTRPPK